MTRINGPTIANAQNLNGMMNTQANLPAAQAGRVHGCQISIFHNDQFVGKTNPGGPMGPQGPQQAGGLLQAIQSLTALVKKVLEKLQGANAGGAPAPQQPGMPPQAAPGAPAAPQQQGGLGNFIQQGLGMIKELLNAAMGKALGNPAQGAPAQNNIQAPAPGAAPAPAAAPLPFRV